MGFSEIEEALHMRQQAEEFRHLIVAYFFGIDQRLTANLLMHVMLTEPCTLKSIHGACCQPLTETYIASTPSQEMHRRRCNLS